jgi:TRAP-type C4-dicarboxylate transport system substrate-binding protein
MNRIVSGVIAFTFALAVSSVASATTLRLTHQFAESGDWRHDMALRISGSLKNSGLVLEVHGAQKIARTREQWSEVQAGRIDLVMGSLSDVIPSRREYEILSMPGVLRDYGHAERFLKSTTMRILEEIGDKDGVRFLSWQPFGTALGSKRDCIETPAGVRGRHIRGAGGAMNEIIRHMGGIPVNVPTTEAAAALKSGALESIHTSTATFVTQRFHESLRCVVVAGDAAYAYLFNMIAISNKTWERLTVAQRDALTKAAAEASVSGATAARAADKTLVDVYTAAGVRVVPLSKENGEAWRQISRESAMIEYADILPVTAELLKAALSVD